MIRPSSIVAGIGVPHTPHYPSMVAAGAPDAAEISSMYGEVAERLEAAAPDVIVFYTADHYNIFFEECIPIFSVGVAPSAVGASDYDTIPRRELPIDAELARGLQRHLVHAGFDVAMSQEFELDHTIVAPMHFLSPGEPVPIVPIFVNALHPAAAERRSAAARSGEAVGRGARGARGLAPRRRGDERQLLLRDRRAAHRRGLARRRPRPGAGWIAWSSCSARARSTRSSRSRPGSSSRRPATPGARTCCGSRCWPRSAAGGRTTSTSQRRFGHGYGAWIGAA